MGKSKKELLSSAIFGSPAYNMLNGIKKSEDEVDAESQEIKPQYDQQPIVNVPIEEEMQDNQKEQINDESAIEHPTNAISSYVQPSDYEEPVVQSQTKQTQAPSNPAANSHIYNDVVNTVQPLTRNYIKTNPVKSKKVCYLITPHIHQNLERIAKESGSSVNQLVNDILNYFIDHYDQSND